VLPCFESVRPPQGQGSVHEEPDGRVRLRVFFDSRSETDFEDRNLFPVLTPDDDTAALPFRYKTIIPYGSKPLVFVNGFKERWAQKREAFKNPPAIMFDGSNPVVHGSLQDYPDKW
jgi:hypothetical protein